MQLSLQFQALVFSLVACVTLGASDRRDRRPVGAVYFMTNDVQENNVAVHNIFSNGTVDYVHSISTGGRGAQYQVLTSGPPGPDGLRSSHSVVVSNNRLYNANPGSDTITMFEINPSNPSQIKRVGNPINSGGNFPVSVAVSSRTGNVCALNGGKSNGVQCFRPTSSGLRRIPNSNRPFNFNETTPATTSDTSFSVSDILFSPDGSKLVASVKGLIQQNTPGFLAVWDVNSDGSLSAAHQTFPAPTNTSQQNFGMTYIHGLEGYAMADSAIGGIFYDFSRGYGPQFRARNIVLPGQLVTCWVSYSNKSSSYFFTDAISDTLYEVTLDLDTLNGTVINQRHMGSQSINLDSAVGTIGSNQYLYSLDVGGFSLFVLDLQANNQSQVIQTHNFTQSLLNDNIRFSTRSLQGIAVYTK